MIHWPCQEIAYWSRYIFPLSLSLSLSRSSITGGIAGCLWAKHFILWLELVQPKKHPDITLKIVVWDVKHLYPTQPYPTLSYTFPNPTLRVPQNNPIEGKTVNKIKFIYSLNFIFDAQKNRLIEVVLLSTDNICLWWKIRKLDYYQLSSRVLTIWKPYYTRPSSIHALILQARSHTRTCIHADMAYIRMYLVIYGGTLKTHQFTLSVSSTWLSWGCFLYHFLSSCKMDHDLPWFRFAHAFHSDVIST